MQNSYKFKFRYEHGGIRASGNGDVKAENIPEAIIIAENGVALDFKGSTADVSIISIRQVTVKKKRRAVRSHV